MNYDQELGKKYLVAYVHNNQNVSIMLSALGDPAMGEFMEQFEAYELRREMKNNRTTKAWLEHTENGHKIPLRLQQEGK